MKKIIKITCTLAAAAILAASCSSPSKPCMPNDPNNPNACQQQIQPPSPAQTA